jgi:alkaline phosphatase D
LKLKLNRRDLLKLGVVQSFLGALPARAENFDEIISKKKSSPSVMQGATDNSKTQFSILFDAIVKLNIFATDSHGNLKLPDKIQEPVHRGYFKRITKSYFSGLDANENYTLHLVDSDTKETVDKRQFKTLDLNKPNLSFAICSCMDELFYSPQIWNTLSQQDPDIIFFIGDFVYADRGTSKSGADPDHLFKRFSDARQTLEIFFMKKLVPILATWDDHDFGLNDGNCENYPYVMESQKNFLDFFAQDESHCELLQTGPGISSAFQFGSQLFFLMDDRSFRRPKGSKDRFAHWGQDQEKWMLDLAKKNEGPVWLLNGSQIFPSDGGNAGESVAVDHRNQFKGLIEEIRSINSKFIFVSGDVHYSEISKIEKSLVGYETFELTSSSVHTISFPGTPDRVPNTRRIAVADGRNFLFVEANPVQLGAKINAKSISKSGKVMFHKRLEV